jgi:hypothetical protein
MDMYRLTQCSGAFPVHDPDAVNATRQTFCEIVVEKVSDFARTKGVQIQFTRYRNRDGVVGFFGCHG